MNCKICKGKLKTWKKGLFDDRHGYPDKFNIQKCQNCGFGQTIPQLSPSKISRIYAKYYPWNKTDITKIKRSDFNKPDWFTIWRKGLFINGQYNVKPKSKVLDVGCGLGHSLLELESIGCKAYGIDPDPNAAKLARKFKLNFKKAFISDNPYPKEKFEYVIANQVLEHTNDPINFLIKCKAKLTEDGKIILSFPNTDSLTRYILNYKWLHWHIPYHLNFFNKRSVNILAQKSGLKIIKIQTVTPNMWTNLQIRRLTQDPKPGDRDQFWDGKGDPNKALTSGIVPKIINFMEEYNLLNRLIDVLGLGESYVVTLKKV